MVLHRRRISTSIIEPICTASNTIRQDKRQRYYLHHFGDSDASIWSFLDTPKCSVSSRSNPRIRLVESVLVFCLVYQLHCALAIPYVFRGDRNHNKELEEFKAYTTRLEGHGGLNRS